MALKINVFVKSRKLRVVTRTSGIGQTYGVVGLDGFAGRGVAGDVRA